MEEELCLARKQHLHVSPNLKIRADVRTICDTATSRPGFLNSMAGVISTLSSVYGTQNHQFSSTSKSTIIVTGSAAIICGILALVYGEWKLKAVKRSHSKEYGKEREPDVEAASPVEGNNEKIPSAA